MKPKPNKNLRLPWTPQREKACGNHQILLPRKKATSVSCINSLTSPAMLLWTMHDHSHKYLYQLSSRNEQKPIGKNNIFTKEHHMKPKWPTSIFEVFDKLVPRLSIYRGKMYAFLVSPRQKPSCKRLNTLGQKQYLAGELGENCLIQV